MRNLTNTAENINNRNLTNSISTNSLLATLPLELTNDGLDDIISLKGLSTIGSASQIIRVNSGGTALEYHTLEVVDLNSTQTLTNKTLSTNCSFTGNRIAKAHLDTTLVDLTTGQVVQNKNLRNCSLNYNSNQTTLIGSFNQQAYIDGTLNLNQNNARAVIRFANDDNNSIYLKQNLLNANCMAFYSFNDIFFYTGNNNNLNQAQYPLRMAITHTGITLLEPTIINANTQINGTLSTASITATSLTAPTITAFKNNDNGLIEITKSNVDNSNNNGTAQLHFKISATTTGDQGSTIITNVAQMGIFDNTTAFRIKNLVNDIELQAGTNINLKHNNDLAINLNFYKGTNFTSLVANNALSSNITVKLPTSGGTLAILADIPTATLPIFLDTNNNITLKGLNNIGSANQIIQVNSSGDGFVYGNLPSSLTATNPLSINNNVISLGGLSNFGTSGQVITSTGSGFTYSTPSSLTNADVLFLVRTQAEDISTFAGNVLNQFPPTDIGHITRNTNITSNLMFLNAQGAYLSISNNSVEKVVISSSISKFKNLLLVSPTSTSLEGNTQFQVDTSGGCKAVLKTTGNNQDIELAFINTNQSGFIKMLASDNSLNFNNFQKYFFRVGSTQRIDFDSDITTNFNSYSFDIAGNQAIGLDSADYYSNVSNSYDFNINSNTVFSLSSTKIRHPIETETNKISYYYKQDTTGFDNTVLRGILYPGNDNDFALISKNIHLRLHAGDVVGQVGAITSANVAIQFFVNNSERAYMTKTLFVVNNFFQVNYNNVNSFTQLTSNVANPKVGLHFINSGTNAFLYFDFSSQDLVYESPANDQTGQRFKINGQAPSIVDANGRGLIARDNTGNFHGVQVGNAVDKLSLNFGSSGSIFTDSNGNLFSDTFTSHSWKISAGNLVFQSDRNLVLYDSNNSPIFASNTSTSDRDKKENIVELEISESIDKVKQLKTYRYNYKDDTEKTPQIGFMADETKPLIPECVKTITNGDITGNLLYKENIVPHLVNTIQSLLSKVELLESRISQLESLSS